MGFVKKSPSGPIQLLMRPRPLLRKKLFCVQVKLLSILIMMYENIGLKRKEYLFCILIFLGQHIPLGATSTRKISSENYFL